MSRWLWLAATLWALSGDPAGARECAAECGSCQKPLCSDATLDECGCCPVCIRQLGESCGLSAEVCAPHLLCHQKDPEHESGICIEMNNEKCLNAPCSVVFNPECPQDSRLEILPPPAGECCGQPGKCVCDQQKCEAFVPICEKGKERILTEVSKGVPGSCCDKFECRAQEQRCATVHCPSQTLDEDAGVEECPADSVRPPTHIPEGTCCLVKPKCRCRGSVCRPASCPEGQKIRILKKGNGNPGRCCDEWTCEEDKQPLAKKCEHGDKRYNDGEEWHSNKCELCKCKKGVAVCSKMACPQVSPQCTWILTPEDECCPVCFGCQTDAMEKKKKHEKWQKDDCTMCTCSEEGAHVCEKHMCKTDCENPRKVEGQCCPVCDEPTIVRPPATCPSLEHCPLRCENGLRRDERGCYLCECLPVDTPVGEKCLELDDENCDKQCAHGYLKDNDGCVVCKCAKCPPLHQCHKHCLYGFETNTAGCPVCKCRASSKLDKKPSLPEKVSAADKCLSLSSTGRVVERDGGEWWSDGCRHCFCEQKEEFCSLISCPARPSECPEDKWVQKEDSCCPTCTVDIVQTSLATTAKHEHTVCQSPGTGRLFTDGETWQLAPCVSCTCRVGHVLCRTSECPPIACENPDFRDDNDCCPRCPDSTISTKDSDGNTVVCTDESAVAHISGSSWRTDDCTSCTCTGEGKIECYREACDDIVCRGSPLVIKGRCCPVCSDALSSSAVCSYQSSVYSVGEQWQDGSCSNCSCVAGGQTLCRQMVCPHCEDPVPIEGHCCPLCKDVGWAPYGLGNGSMTPALPPSDHRGSNSVLPLFGLSLMSLAIVGLVIVLLLLYKRSRNSNRLHKLSEVGHMSSGASSVRLSATKAIGSMPRLVDWQHDERQGVVGGLLQSSRRRDSHSDGQSDSLLSTASDSSTAPSSASSGAGAIPDTQPLTKSKRYPV